MEEGKLKEKPGRSKTLYCTGKILHKGRRKFSAREEGACIQSQGLASLLRKAKLLIGWKRVDRFYNATCLLRSLNACASIVS